MCLHGISRLYAHRTNNPQTCEYLILSYLTCANLTINIEIKGPPGRQGLDGAVGEYKNVNSNDIYNNDYRVIQRLKKGGA